MDLLLAQSSPIVKSMLRAYVGTGEDAKDLVQEVLCEVYRSLSKLRAPAKFTAWLARICQGKATDRLRRRYREEELFSFEAGFRLEDVPTPANKDAFLDLLHTDLLESIEEAIDRLPQRYHQVLALRFRECLDIAEIAAATGQKTGTVKSLLSRGMTKLRTEFERGA